ncbi:MAG: GNAT family N-acetyltransferase [Planctomycetia bacterium]|nr:GNAT family N-acetyltransferase [Planctomycetia bacterium]
MPPPFASRPRLETPRLHLAPANASDAQALQSLWNEPEVRKYLWDGEEVPLEKAREAVEAMNAGFREKGYGLWCVSLRHSGVLAGFCGLRGFGDAGAVELLFGLAPSRTGQGYATEAARAVLAHAFGACGLVEVWGRVDEPNARSAKLLERLGMSLRRTTAGKRHRLLEHAVAVADFRTA